MSNPNEVVVRIQVDTPCNEMKSPKMYEGPSDSDEAKKCTDTCAESGNPAESGFEDAYVPGFVVSTKYGVFFVAAQEVRRTPTFITFYNEGCIVASFSVDVVDMFFDPQFTEEVLEDEDPCEGCEEPCCCEESGED